MPVDLSNEKYVVLSHDNAHATIYYYGATLTSWVVEGKERIFVSSKAILDGSKAIRGGIPLAFPHFGTVESSKLPQHGFARNSKWTFVGLTFENANESTAVFSLTPEGVPAELSELWPFGFKLFYTVSLLSSPARLRTSLRVVNTDSKEWEFTALLHTYFKVDDITKVGVSGLQSTTYFDKPTQTHITEESSRVTINSEVDRAYLKVRGEVLVDQLVTATVERHGIKFNEEGLVGLLKIRKSSSMSDVVVWNLWEEKAKAMADMGDEDYLRYICVEVGAVEPFIKLGPGESWEGFQIVEAIEE
ncbi:hypothetical protein HK098_006527 [Nowakowskiella sp. JEL0407]|nr:hypothetical protein HK098_006527 [Nowakowskiella sp. JEL0407]